MKDNKNSQENKTFHPIKEIPEIRKIKEKVEMIKEDLNKQGNILVSTWTWDPIVMRESKFTLIKKVQIKVMKELLVSKIKINAMKDKLLDIVSPATSTNLLMKTKNKQERINKSKHRLIWISPEAKFLYQTLMKWNLNKKDYKKSEMTSLKIPILLETKKVKIVNQLIKIISKKLNQ